MDKNKKYENDITATFPRTFKLKLSDIDVERLYRRAAAYGLTPEGILESVISDLIDGTASNGWAEYELANEWFDCCYFEYEYFPTLLSYLTQKLSLSLFLDLYDLNCELKEEIEYLMSDCKISESQRGETLAYYMQLINENSFEMSSLYNEYRAKNPRCKTLEDEIKIILDFREKLNAAISEKGENADERSTIILRYAPTI